MKKRSREGQGERTKKRKANPEALHQEETETRIYYCIVPSEKRFGLLATFLKRNLKKKVVVVFASYGSLLFHSEVLSALGIKNLVIHGKVQDEKVVAILEQLEKEARGLLLITEPAVYDLTLPIVDWIIQFESPCDVEKYGKHIHRYNNRGLMYVLPHELQFLKEIKALFVQCEFSDAKIGNLHTQMEKLVQKNYRIHQLSLDAYRSYFRTYASHLVKSIFDVKKLDLQAASASFGIKCPPKV